MKKVLGSKTLIIVLVTLIATGSSLLLTAKANTTVISGCVTKADWESSLQDILAYGDIYNVGETKLYPRQIVKKYQIMINCVVNNRAFGNASAYDRQLVLLPRLALIKSVSKDLDSNNRLCLQMDNNSKVCSDK